jgi:hypothetical protein
MFAAFVDIEKSNHPSSKLISPEKDFFDLMD